MAAVIISKYLAYYTKEIPKSLQAFVFNDHNVLMVKDGLSDVCGFKCPRLSLQVMSVNSRIDGQRIIAINNLFASLIKTGLLEHFTKI